MSPRKKILTKFYVFFLSFILVVFLTQNASSAVNSTVVSKIGTTSKTIALTFDAGSDAGNTARILDILAKYDIKCTFFLTGQFAASNPALTRRILNEGHEIGNHSWSHPYFTNISLAQMKDQLAKTRNKITEVTGKAPSPLFRPPYGSYNSTVLQAAGETGYRWTVMWTIDTVDWKGISATEIRRRVLDKASPGSIVLMHVGGGAKYTPAALPGIIESLKSRGYSMKTLSQMLSDISAQRKYVVQRGDTLYGIARKFGVTVQDLIKANNISNPNLIYIGQILAIPTKSAPPAAPRTYVVQRGDTLYAISRRFGVTVDAIAKANKIPNPRLIYPGQVLVIP